MAVEAGKAREARPAARKPDWRERRSRWREAGLAREVRPVVEEAGGKGSDHGARRSCRGDVARSSAHEGWSTGGAPVQWSHMSAEVEWWWSIGDERQVKTQPGLGHTDKLWFIPPPEGVVVPSHPSRVFAG
uniref:Uncharacterized protein n=1 Tax=Oryza rufipogon TaxID=4529 RepID=A0A0E0MZL6_ORYRU